MSKLKPCPFCGGDAARLDLEDEGDGENFGGSIIECTRCHASTAVHFDRKENLYSSWNNRRMPASGFTGSDFLSALDQLASNDNATIRAALSNNLNVIIAALRLAASSDEDD